MSPAKQRMIQIIHDLPDDSSCDEILRELAFARMVDNGLADVDAGRTIPHDELKKRSKTWRS